MRSVDRDLEIALLNSYLCPHILRHITALGAAFLCAFAKSRVLIHLGEDTKTEKGKMFNPLYRNEPPRACALPCRSCIGAVTRCFYCSTCDRR